jgi:hypothetical protein
MRRTRVQLTAVLAAIALPLVVAGPVAADEVYHTERLTLEAVGDAAGSGFVVNIHPNGPLVFASERYALRGAAPNTTYSVHLIVDASALDCPFAGLDITMAAAMTTNRVGNATTPADFYFTPEAIPPCLHNGSFPIHWEVRLGTTTTHTTDVTIVTLD